MLAAATSTTRAGCSSTINIVVTYFALRYDLSSVTIDKDDGLESLKSAASVLKRADPHAELFVLVDEYDRFSN